MRMSRNLKNRLSKPTDTVSLDSSSVKADGFQSEGDSMSKKKRQIAMQPGQVIELDSSVKVESIGSKFRAIADEITPELYQRAADHLQGLVLGKGLDPTPREDEARPCSLCESRRPAGKSYSRVYCTKRQVRYCKCHYCGHTWSQERR